MSVEKVAIITGASSGTSSVRGIVELTADQHPRCTGIGRHTAIALSAAGWRLTLTARRLPELQETKAACADPEKCLLVDGDIADEAFVKRLFEQTIHRFGRLDLLFNVCPQFAWKAKVLASILHSADLNAKNAGRSDKPYAIEDMPLELFRSVVDVNLVASFLCTREAFKIFKSQTPAGGESSHHDKSVAHSASHPSVNRQNHQQRLTRCTCPATALCCVRVLQARRVWSDQVQCH